MVGKCKLSRKRIFKVGRKHDLCVSRCFGTIETNYRLKKGLIFRGQKIVIPKSLCAEMLKQAHKGHLCVTKTLDIFWPGMTKEIQDYMLHCDVCLQCKRSFNATRSSSGCISKTWIRHFLI